MIDVIAIAIAAAAIALVVASIWVPGLRRAIKWCAGALAVVGAYLLGKGTAGAPETKDEDEKNVPEPEPEQLEMPDLIRLDIERDRDDAGANTPSFGPSGRLERLEKLTED